MPTTTRSAASTSNTTTDSQATPPHDEDQGIHYVGYSSEKQLGAIMALVDRDLSEPYSIFTYRYFLLGWPQLCILAYADKKEGSECNNNSSSSTTDDEDDHDKKMLVGVIVGKADNEGSNDPNLLRGYIAMLAVETSYRRAGIGRKLVSRAVDQMVKMGCQEVMLETEVTNQKALNLYAKQGFAREERLLKYYLNGVDAFRLKLWLEDHAEMQRQEERIASAAAAASAYAGGGGGVGVIDQHKNEEEEESIDLSKLSLDDSRGQGRNNKKK